MIYLEDYTISYELYLAENEMIESLFSYIPMIQESCGLEIISEGVKETILKYLTRIAEALSKVWDKFKNIFYSKIDRAYLKHIADKIDNADGKFTMTNFPNYDFTKLEAIKIVTFDYEQMKESLKNKSDFLSKFYPNINPGEGSIKQAIENNVITSRQDTRCDNAMIKQMYEFCSDNFQPKIDAIENDLKSVNSSNKNIETIVNTVTNVGEASTLLESYLIEAKPTIQPNKNNEDKVEIKDDPERENKEKREEILKAVTTYTKVSTEICTSKMNILKDCYNLYMRMLRHAIPDKKSNDEEKENVEASNTGNVDTQIKTD